MFWTNRGKFLLLEWVFCRTPLPINFYVMLITADNVPTVDTNILSELTEIADGNGYTEGGYALTPGATDFDVITEDDFFNRALVQIKNIIWTANEGPIPASGDGARYVVLTDDSESSALAIGDRQVIAVWDMKTDRVVTNGFPLALDDLELRVIGLGVGSEASIGAGDDVLTEDAPTPVEERFEHYSDELPITEYAVPTWRGVYYGDLVHQTFTPEVSHLLTKVRLYLRKNDIDNDNDLFWGCQIFATTDGEPSGSALVSKIIYSQSTPFDWQWVDFVFDSQITLTAETMYAIRFYMTPAASQDPINWARRGSDVYSRGQIWHWIWRSYLGPETPIYPGELEDGASEGDLFFEEWGYEL